MNESWYFGLFITVILCWLVFGVVPKLWHTGGKK